MSAIATRVTEIIADQLNVGVETVQIDATLVTLGADSLDVVELIMRFEDEFDIEIADADVEKLETVGQVIAYLERAVTAQNTEQ